ncbi:MAG: DUF2019 domain-containing protein [Ruminococcus sp.]|uniref:hypothetical protein n=1 Tax=Ruminococcus sp. TaxID=41978 RepID=UPI0025DE7B9F|nr:hypothetical protein [Ruminococcus sp.]MCR5599829.1 DUF2019 domain-containing protein [Ruminococcus sp.]
MKKDDLDYVIEALQKRDEILIKDKSIRQYNKYFDIMRKYARKLIDDGRQAELLPLLDSDNISYRSDAAGLLFHCYPEKCQKVLKDISEMSVETGLPKYYINLSISAIMALEHGIPKDFP